MSIIASWAFSQQPSANEIEDTINKMLSAFEGIEFFAGSGDNIVILPDWGLPVAPEAGINTTPAVIAAVVNLAREAGCGMVSLAGKVADGFDFDQVLQISGYARLCEDLEIDFIDLSQTMTATRATTNNLAQDNMQIYQCLLHADTLINIPKLKSENGSLFGGSFINIAKGSPDLTLMQPQQYQRALVDLYDLREPDLTIVDCLKGNKGYQQLPQSALLIGRDLLAIDIVLATLIGADPNNIEYLRLAAAYAMGDSQPGDIIILGEALRKMFMDKQQ